MKVKKLLAGLISVALILGTVSIPVFADETTVATETELKSAIANGGTITLADNITLDSSLEIESAQNITLNLNEKKLQLSDTSANNNPIVNNGTLTVTGNGTINGKNNAIFNNATLTIENGTFTGTNYHGIYNGGTATINRGTFNGCNNGVSNEGTVTINDGTFTGTNFNGIYNGGTATINGGTFSGTDWDVFNYGTLTISGGNFIKEGIISGDSDEAPDATLTITNGSFDKMITNMGKDLKISNGTFSSKVSNATEITGGTFHAVSYNTAKASESKISGGTFDIESNSWTKEFLTALGNGNNLSNVKFTKNAVDEFANAKESLSSRVRLAASCGYKFGEASADNTYTIQYVGTANFYAAAGSNGSVSATKFFSSSDSIHTAAVTKGYTITNGVDIVDLTATPDDSYIFSGWYTNENGEGTPVSTANPLDSYTMPESDTTLYAVFTKDAGYISWIADYDTKTNFAVNNTAEMKFLAYAVNTDGKDFSGKTVTLSADLAYTANDDFEPVGTKNKPFRGTFDGGNHTISGIVSKGKYTYTAVFGNTSGTVKNLKVKDCTFIPIPKDDAYGYAGGIAAEALGKIENCSAENVTVGGWFAGGIVGHSFGITITDVTATNITYTESSGKCGAIIGYADDLTLNGATVSGFSAVSTTVGSVVGHINAGKHTLSNITVTVKEDETKFPVFGSAYSTANKTITLSDSDITASSILGKEIESGDLKITGGNYTIDNLAPDSTGIIISGGTYNIDVSTCCDEGYAAIKSADGSYTVTNLTWDYDTDSGFYEINNEKRGMMRFMFRVNTTETVSKIGIIYLKADKFEEGLTEFDAPNHNGEKAVQGDIVNIEEGTNGNYYAMAYFVTGNGQTILSDPVSCKINWNQQFTKYEPQKTQEVTE